MATFLMRDRRRRVKCDEARPSCNRCIRAGKSCEGYAHDPESGRGSEPVRFVVYTPHNPTPLLSEHPDLDWSERRALSYFQDRTALELAGAFQPDFWLATILPLARQESSVRHALIALSSMHEQFASVDHFSPTRSVDFALHHYGKAIREVVRLNQSQLDQTFDSSLVTCALFSAFESLQGQYHEACCHAVSGIRILAEEQRKPNTNTIMQTRVPREDLTRFFVAMERQILEIGDPNFPVPRPKFYHTKAVTAIPDQFTSHEHALLHLEFLLAELVEYVERADTLTNEGLISEDVGLSLLTEFHAIKMQFEKWQAAFDAFSSIDLNEYSKETPDSSSSTSSSPPADRSRPRSPAFLILRAYQALMTAFLARVEINDEAVYNDYRPQFWMALDAVEEFIQCTSTFVRPVDSRTPSRSPFDPTTTTTTSTSNLAAQSSPQQPLVARPTFSLALGIVPTLFLIASRTLDLELRDKAISLLRMCNRREGLWDSRLAAIVVDRVIELREKAIEMSRAQQPLADADLNPAAQATTSSETERKDVSQGAGVSSHKVVEFKLLDIKFLPGRRCGFRYAFATRYGNVEGTPIPMMTSEPTATHVPGASLYSIKEFWEELRWKG
ncbi:hypothetical protein AYL99_06534 [Fonsecaea erecta]|uniref:Zn(2)-C6 fungal-type domain-containing protein n=1 Tax=Fonsecaea erecta TaxID=1367422 RepID=A0A178ZII9_9EURO|nr:hypothetical protein AYL99_06534 [Fonsecaea erecta]OAP59236.1 hypothetical protein AYL99_06534 [Fonsecaea erecta]